MTKHVAVTGTKGKSTVLRLLEAAFLNENKNVFGAFGIDGHFYNKELIKSGMDCSEYLVWDKDRYRADLFLSEATSWVLFDGHYQGATVDVGVFTSFDKDEHSEIHPEDGSYLEAKRQLFNYLGPGGQMIVCRDIDNYSDIVAGYEEQVITYGSHPESDYLVSIKHLCKDVMKFTITRNSQETILHSSFIGKVNALNIAAAYAACDLLNVDMEQTKRAFERFSGFPGRLERYIVPKTKNIIVIDYAHTNDSLSALISLCKEAYPNKSLVTIFGCGGNKCTSKRKLMGETAKKLSDFTIITNDNPRRENPVKIVREILSAFPKETSEVTVIMDRSEAIKSALSRCRNSVIIIAGKGNECEIEFKDYHVEHNDRDCLVEWCLQNNLQLVSYS